MQYKYPFNITWSEEDEEYIATCEAFPGLSALGETEEEALKEGKIALKLFIDACIEEGIPLPSAKVIQEYSGQWRVRTPKSLHRRAVYMAEEEGVSLNQYTNYALSEKVAADENASKIHKRLEGTLRDLKMRQIHMTDRAAYSSQPPTHVIKEKIVREPKEVTTSEMNETEWNN
ncbi:MAG: toxin-antitoxin system HicB family antitoxin [Pyrinomonadaceae bacterium]